MRMGLSSLHTLTKLAYKAHSHECPGEQTHLHVLQYTRVTHIKSIASDAKSGVFACFRENSHLHGWQTFTRGNKKIDVNWQVFILEWS